VNLVILSYALFWMAHAFLEFGQRRRAEKVMAEMKALAERSAQPHLLVLSMLNDATMAIWDGRLEEALAIRRDILTRAEELGILLLAAVFTSFLLPARVHLGNPGRALESNIRGSKDLPQNLTGDMVVLYCLAQLGRYDEVAEMLERMVVTRPGVGSPEDETSVWVDIISLEAAVLAGHRQAAELLLHRLAGSSIITNGQLLPTCTGRHLGAAAAFLGKNEEARTYYEKAIKDCTEMKFRPELALSRLQLSELLLEHYPTEKEEALAHLDFAIKEFQDMKMQPSLERALRHKEILKA
jgi:tetratricopeptide (TPR) repeat protein